MYPTSIQCNCNVALFSSVVMRRLCAAIAIQVQSKPSAGQRDSKSSARKDAWVQSHLRYFE